MTEEARVRYEATVEGVTVIRVASFELREAISTPFDLRVSLRVPRDTDPETLLGQDLVFVMARPEHEERTVGIVTEVRSEGLDRAGATEGELALVVRVQPALALLAMRRGSRIFQDRSVPEIVASVLDEGLGPYGRSARPPEGSYAPREYCVQYEESDLDFVHRLLEEEGIHYVFDHQPEREVLVLADRNGAFEDVGTIPFVPHDMVIEDQEAVRIFSPAKRVAITHVELRDFDFTTASAPVTGEAGADDADFAGERRLYEHGLDRRMTAASLRARANVRHQAHRVASEARTGVSQALVIRPGRVFELGGSPPVGADRRYLVTEVVHEPRGVTRGGSDEGYSARFTCAPAELEYRAPRRAPRPFVDGVETAKVVGPAGEEIHVDEHGRVKVLFPWDREGARAERSSCWLRVEQPWAGDGWGWMFVPRIGMEVVVQFVDGNPDRPLVTGCVYDGENLTPYPLPDDKTKSTFKTNSSLGGGGFNELRFEDLAGSEQIFTHAQKDQDEEVLHCHTTDVGHDQENTVDGDQTQTVHHDQSETVHGDQKMTVHGHRKVHVKTNFDEKIDGGETRAVLGGSDETYRATETRRVHGGITEAVIGNEKHDVTGNKTEIIVSGQTQVVVAAASESVTSTSSTYVSAGVTVLTPAAAVWNGASGATLRAGSKVSIIAPPSLSFTFSSLADNCSTMTQMGTSSIGIIGIVKGESVGSKTETVAGAKIGMLHSQIAAWGMKSSNTAVKLGKASTKIDIVGVLVYQGTFKNTTFDFDITL